MEYFLQAVPYSYALGELSLFCVLGGWFRSTVLKQSLNQLI